MTLVSCDVLIKDFKHETLKTVTAEKLGVSYLSKARETEAKKWFKWVMITSTSRVVDDIPSLFLMRASLSSWIVGAGGYIFQPK
jgi:hypothetical protein